MEHLLELAVALATATDIDDLLVCAGRGIREAFTGARRVSVCLPVEHDLGTLEVFVVDGAASVDGGQRFPERLRLASTALSEQRTIVTKLDGGESGVVDWLRELGVDVVVSAPLTMRGNRLGVLNIGFAVPDGAALGAGDVDPNDIDIAGIELAATLVAGQLDRLTALTKALDRAERRADDTGRLLRLHRIERSLSEVSNLDELLAALSGPVAELVAATRVSFSRRLFGQGKLSVVGVHGMERMPSGTILPVDERELEERYRDATFRYTPNHAESSNPNDHTVMNRSGIHSSANFGVFVHGAVAGTLNVGCTEVDALDDEDLALLGALASFMGNTLERIEAQAELTYSANHDSVTGLMRRARFEAALESAVAERSGALVFIDIDDFKLVNDLHGHAAGDGILRQLAAWLTTFIGEGELVARLGGDEFAVLLRGGNPLVQKARTESLVTSVADRSFTVRDRQLPLTVSAGLCTFDADEMSSGAALSYADAACYSVKRLGGNSVALAAGDDVDQQSVRLAANRLSAVRAALANDDFVLYGQPIIDFDRGQAQGVEVLLRMHQDGTVQTGSTILAAAEHHGLGETVDLWVLRKVLDTWPEILRRSGSATRLFVNLSVNSVCSAGFVDEVEDLLRNADFPTGCLCFEITETGTMRYFDIALAFVRRMQALGVTIALDDFGVGLSSLGHLRQLPVDYLKLDGSLVVGVESDEVVATMVRAVVLMADALGIPVIAEHIENDQAITHLRELGVSLGQGFHLGRPAPVLEAVRRLEVQTARYASPG